MLDPHEAGLVCYSPWGCKELDMNGRLNHSTHDEASTNLTADVCNNPLKAIYVHLNQLGEYLRSVRHVA